MYINCLGLVEIQRKKKQSHYFITILNKIIKINKRKSKEDKLIREISANIKYNL